MERSVLRDIDHLTAMLSPMAAADKQPYSAPTAPNVTWSIPVHHGSEYSAGRGGDQLGRAIEAAEEELDAALRRTTGVHKTQLKQKEIEVAELRSNLEAREREVESLRATLNAAKVSYDQRLSQLESNLLARESEVSSLSAQVLALRAERDELQERCQAGTVSNSSMQNSYQEQLLALSATCRSQQHDINSLQGQLQQCTHDKDLLSLEVAELRQELEGLEEELGLARQEGATVSSKYSRQKEVNRDLQAALQKAQAQAQLVLETKDLEISEMRRRLKAERGVRKACEKWLKQELRGREELESLLVAVRDIAVGVPGIDDDAVAVEHLMAQAKAAATGGEAAAVAAAARTSSRSGSGGQRLSSSVGEGSSRRQLGGAAADRARQEFTLLKGALAADSTRLKQELATAKQLLQEKLQELGSSCR